MRVRIRARMSAGIRVGVRVRVPVHLAHQVVRHRRVVGVGVADAARVDVDRD